MRLIDADALKLAFENCEVCKKCPSESDRCLYKCIEPGSLTPGIERVIDAKQTVDAVLVIRCKDCTFGHYIDHGHMHCVHPCGLTTNMTNDFCSYAEQKEKNNERMG